ncbi:potassium channel subfamily K member 13 [Cricetulus griseus]|nr:potassium channel subfamily K member 13 [Cricetulus griseus]
MDSVRPRWDFTGAFYFVGTVVSTIEPFDLLSNAATPSFQLPDHYLTPCRKSIPKPSRCKALVKQGR